ncbi:hypothetical protein ACJX0J_037167, partial [Zea mays]
MYGLLPASFLWREWATTPTRAYARASIQLWNIQASSKRMKTMDAIIKKDLDFIFPSCLGKKIWFLTLFVWGPIFQYFGSPEGTSKNSEVNIFMLVDSTLLYILSFTTFVLVIELGNREMNSLFFTTLSLSLSHVVIQPDVVVCALGLLYIVYTTQLKGLAS